MVHLKWVLLAVCLCLIVLPLLMNSSDSQDK